MNERLILIFIIIVIIILIFCFNRKIENYGNQDIMLSLNEIYKKNTSFKNIKYVNGVPKVVYIVWFGRKISNNRLKALNNLISNIGVPYILITEDNYKLFEDKKNKIHPAFEYLSGNHKSDYLRSYLLHHYGGGYHDVKYREKSWINEWDTFKDKKIWIKTRRETQPFYIGYDIDNPETKFIQDKFNELGTMGYVICRQKTKYTKELLEKIHSKLDFHYENLKKNPSEKPEGYYADTPFEKVSNVGCSYPLRWLELMGEHYHLLMYKYKEHINFELPDTVKILYK